MSENMEGHRARLRERFKKNGLHGFAEHEVLELLLTLCIPRKDVKALAKTLLKRFGNICCVFDANPKELLKVSGIGEVSVTCLNLIKAFSVYYLQQKTSDVCIFDNNEALINFWKVRLGGLKHEVFEVAYLDSGYRLLSDGIIRMEEGMASKIQIYPRKVIEVAFLRGASNIVIAHNHPSGDPKPSQADFSMTQTLRYIGNALSLRLLDHIIITKDSFYSFRQDGFLD